jgi:hypothetical protein
LVDNIFNVVFIDSFQRFELARIPLTKHLKNFIVKMNDIVKFVHPVNEPLVYAEHGSALLVVYHQGLAGILSQFGSRYRTQRLVGRSVNLRNFMAFPQTIYKSNILQVGRIQFGFRNTYGIVGTHRIDNVL